MSTCLYGTRKQANAPESFTIDSGAICFVLNVDNVICPLLDKIPELVGQPYKKIISQFARDVIGLAVDIVLDQINTEEFCSSEPPQLPQEITFDDVFSFIASYVPPLSFVASADALLNKISRYYLYEKWFEFCECKPRGSEPAQGTRDPIPNFVASCPESAIYTTDLQGAIDLANAQNAQAPPGRVSFIQFADGGSINSITEQQYNDFLDEYRNPPSPFTLDEETESISRDLTIFDEIQLGCLSIRKRGGSFYSVLKGFKIRNTSTSQIDRKNLGYDEYQVAEISYDESACCIIPPPAPELPPPPMNCIPVPPPRFCELFPDDPLCANVPDGGNTSILVDDYDCSGGLTQKVVVFKL